MLRQTRSIMGMPITVMVADQDDAIMDVESVFDLFRAVDERFSTYKASSEVMALNRGEVAADTASPALREVLALCETARVATSGYFDIQQPGGRIDPSGLVKGWSVLKAAELLVGRGRHNYFIEAGGEIVTAGTQAGQPWRVGIRHPTERDHYVKRLKLSGESIATSGTYERGEHIYDPLTGRPPLGLRSVSIVGPNIMLADVYATAVYAMGAERGLAFMLRQDGYEAMLITAEWQALLTPGFDRYTIA